MGLLNFLVRKDSTVPTPPLGQATYYSSEDEPKSLSLKHSDGTVERLGKPGTDGKDGAAGKDGTNGKDGKEGPPGPGITPYFYEPFTVSHTGEWTYESGGAGNLEVSGGTLKNVTANDTPFFNPALTVTDSAHIVKVTPKGVLPLVAIILKDTGVGGNYIKAQVYENNLYVFVKIGESVKLIAGPKACNPGERIWWLATRQTGNTVRAAVYVHDPHLGAPLPLAEIEEIIPAEYRTYVGAGVSGHCGLDLIGYEAGLKLTESTLDDWTVIKPEPQNGIF